MGRDRSKPTSWARCTTARSTTSTLARASPGPTAPRSRRRRIARSKRRRSISRRPESSKSERTDACCQRLARADHLCGGHDRRQPRRVTRARRRRLPRSIPQPRDGVSLHRRCRDQPDDGDRDVEHRIGRPCRQTTHQHETRDAARSGHGGRQLPRRCHGAIRLAVAVAAPVRHRRRDRGRDHVEPLAPPERDPRPECRSGPAGRPVPRGRERLHRHLSRETAAAGRCRVVRRRQRVVASRHRRRHHQGAGAERLVRHSAPCGSGDQRVHDRRDRDRGRDDLLRARTARAGSCRRRVPGRAARFVGRDEIWRGRLVEVAEDPDGRRAASSCPR